MNTTPTNNWIDWEEEAIKRSREAGYEPGALTFTWSPFLDKEFWKCLGVNLGWGFHEEVIYEEEWRDHWHRFIDHIANGGEINDFFKSLLSEDK